MTQVAFPRNSRNRSASWMSSSQLRASWSLVMTPWRSWNYACHPKWKAKKFFWEKWCIWCMWGFGWTMEGGGALSGIDEAVQRLQNMKDEDAWMTRAAGAKMLCTCQSCYSSKTFCQQHFGILDSIPLRTSEGIHYPQISAVYICYMFIIHYVLSIKLSDCDVADAARPSGCSILDESQDWLRGPKSS